MGSVTDIMGNILDTFLSFADAGSAAGQGFLDAGSSAVDSFRGIATESLGV